jgi:hypothetical protein
VAQPWYRDVAKTSLIACIASAVSLVSPLREAVRLVFEGRTVAAPLVALAALLTLVTPLFYLCVFRDLQERELLLSNRLQLLSSAAALALLAATAASLPEWIRAFTPGSDASVLAARESHLPALLNGLANLAAMLPLIALSAQPAAESGLRTTVSPLLRVVAAVAAIAFGLFTAFSAIGLIVSPWTASQAHSLAVQAGRNAPGLARVAGQAARSLLGQFGLFVAPYVVWRSTSR